MVDYFTGKSKESPRKEFWYLDDEARFVAARYMDWKLVFLANREKTMTLWREPFVELRAPLLFNLRRDPFERAQHNSNTYTSITPTPTMTGGWTARDSSFLRSLDYWRISS
jgi:arylsulfatase